MGRKHVRKSGRKPIVGATNRTGRNQPCPCGSRKKFKTCCNPLKFIPTLSERQAAEMERRAVAVLKGGRAQGRT
jgi:hypothetical protein